METATVYTYLLHVIGWVWVSPTLVRSMSNFVCTICACIKLYVAASTASSVGHSYCAPLLPPRVPSASLNEYVQQWDHAWARPTDAVRWSGKRRPLRLSAPPMCSISFTLAPHTCSSLCCRSLRWRPGNWMWQKPPQVFASLLQWCNRYSHIVQLCQRTRFSYGAINPFQLYCKVHIPQGCVTTNTISPQHIVGYEGQLPP